MGRRLHLSPPLSSSYCRLHPIGHIGHSVILVIVGHGHIGGPLVGWTAREEEEDEAAAAGDEAATPGDKDALTDLASI